MITTRFTSSTGSAGAAVTTAAAAVTTAAFAVCFALTAPAWAQTTPQAAPVPAATSALYAAFGETAGTSRLANDFVDRLVADARTAPHFKKSDLPNLKLRLAEQFCQVTGGPCVYKGADMKTAHQDLDINKADFNALVEVLQQSMRAQGIAFSAQNQLLARLAPMHRDVITVK